MKNFFIFIGALFLLMCTVLITSSLVVPKENNFEVRVNFEKLEYHDKEEVNLEAVFKNKTLGFFRPTFGYSPVYIQVYEFGENPPAVLSIAIKSVMVPRGEFNYSSSFVFDIEKDYYVSAISNFTYKGRDYYIENKYTIIDGRVEKLI